MTGNNAQTRDKLALVRLVIHGDQAAFQLLMRYYEPALLTYLTCLLRDRENARDVAQETFIAAFRALPRWVPPQQIEECDGQKARQASPSHAHPLAPWLYRIATNHALNFLNKQPIQAPLSLQALTEQFRDRQATLPAESGERHLTLEERYIMREVLQEALGRLSEDDAVCLILRFVADERYAEIAARLGLTAEAVRKRVTRGLAALRAAYQELEQEVSL